MEAFKFWRSTKSSCNSLHKYSMPPLSILYFFSNWSSLIVSIWFGLTRLLTCGNLLASSSPISIMQYKIRSSHLCICIQTPRLIPVQFTLWQCMWFVGKLELYISALYNVRIYFVFWSINSKNVSITFIWWSEFKGLLSIKYSKYSIVVQYKSCSCPSRHHQTPTL